MILRKTLEEAHPGLYWYSDRTDMDKYFDSTQKLLAHEMTTIEFFKVLLPVVAMVKCVHTNLQLPTNENSGAGLQRILPFELLCQEGKVFIIKDFGHTAREGAEVLSINNISTKEILSTLFDKLPADGYNETHKYYLLSSGAFREGYALYYGQPESFTVTAADPVSRKSSGFTVRAKTPKVLSGLIASAGVLFSLLSEVGTAGFTRSNCWAPLHLDRLVGVFPSGLIPQWSASLIPVRMAMSPAVRPASGKKDKALITHNVCHRYGH